MICSASIAYQNEWTNATIGSVGSPVTVFTVATSGLYRITVGGIGTFAAYTGGAGLDFNWQNTPTTVSNTVTLSVGTISVPTVKSAANTTSVYLSSGDTIDVWTDMYGENPSPVSLFMTIEQLQ